MTPPELVADSPLKEMAPFFAMLGAFLVSAAIARLTRQRLWAVVIPTMAVGLFVSVGAVREPTWFIGLFLMAAVPYGIISFIGASVGYHQSNRKSPPSE